MSKLVLMMALVPASLPGFAQEVLIFSGGWKGHKPQETAALIQAELEVLGYTDYSSVEPGLRMPVAWVKSWGRGRVFYSALGHTVLSGYDKFPEAKSLMMNGFRRATREH